MRNELMEVRGWLAAGVATGFLLICLATFALVAGTTGLESWAAGVIGAVVGYWASGLAQILSFYYGSSQSNTQNRQTLDRMVDAQVDAAKALAEKVPAQRATPQPVEIVNPQPVQVDVVGTVRPATAPTTTPEKPP